MTRKKLPLYCCPVNSMVELALNSKHSFLSMSYNLGRNTYNESGVRGLKQRTRDWFLVCEDRLHKMYETLQAESMNRVWLSAEKER